jgi:hypothetical protein
LDVENIFSKQSSIYAVITLLGAPAAKHHPEGRNVVSMMKQGDK